MGHRRREGAQGERLFCRVNDLSDAQKLCLQDLIPYLVRHQYSNRARSGFGGPPAPQTSSQEHPSDSLDRADSACSSAPQPPSVGVVIAFALLYINTGHDGSGVIKHANDWLRSSSSACIWAADPDDSRFRWCGREAISVHFDMVAALQLHMPGSYVP